MHLRQGGGNAHGHVHHRAQGADDHPRHQQAPQTQGRARLPQLQQRLHIRQAQAVDAQQALGQQAEQQRQGRAGDGAQCRADGLAAHTAQDHHGHNGDIRADEKYRQKRGCALHQQGDHHKEQARQRDGQGHQGFRAHLAAHGHRGQQKQAHDHRQPHGPVIFIHRGGVAAVSIGGDQHHRPLARFQSLAVQGAHIVVDLHGLALVLARADLGQQQLLAPIAAVGHGVFLGVIRQDICDDGGLILGVILAPGLGLLMGHRQGPDDDEHHHRSRQDDAAEAVFAPPGAHIQRICLFPVLHRSFLPLVILFSIASSGPSVKSIRRRKIPRIFGGFSKNLPIFFHSYGKRRVAIPGGMWYNVGIHTKSLLQISGILHSPLSWSLGSPLGNTESVVKGRLPALRGMGGFFYLRTSRSFYTSTVLDFSLRCYSES